VVGGGAKSPLWRRIYADILKKTVVYSSVARDAAALGAAALAFKGTGVWNNFDKIKEIHNKGNELPYIKDNYLFYKKQKDYFNLVCNQQADLYSVMH
jgi:xylulokinase